MKRRQTIQKHLVLEAVTTLCHASADEVYFVVAKKFPSISKGTVYRNLNDLVQNGQIVRIQVPDGADYFDKTTTPHYHVRCRHCGKVDDVMLPYQVYLNKAPAAHGFQIQGHTLIFDGVCAACQSTKG